MKHTCLKEKTMISAFKLLEKNAEMQKIVSVWVQENPNSNENSIIKSEDKLLIILYGRKIHIAEKSQ